MISRVLSKLDSPGASSHCYTTCVYFPSHHFEFCTFGFASFTIFVADLRYLKCGGQVIQELFLVHVVFCNKVLIRVWCNHVAGGYA